MYIAAYIFYALVQAIVVGRYGFTDDDSPVGVVVGMTIAAPLVSVILLGMGFHTAIKWLVTYRPKPKAAKIVVKEAE